MMAILNNFLLPGGGALLGYLASDKEAALRNALIGGAIGFGLKWLMKPTSAQPIPQEDEDLPPISPSGPMLPPPNVIEVPPVVEQPQPDEMPEYTPDTGEQEDWVGKDPFPVGSIARFAYPLQTGSTTVASHAVKMSNGNWVTQPGQQVYWTSIGSMARDNRVSIVDVIDSNEQMQLWGSSSPEPLNTYP